MTGDVYCDRAISTRLNGIHLFFYAQFALVQFAEGLVKALMDSQLLVSAIRMNERSWRKSRCSCILSLARAQWCSNMRFRFTGQKRVR